MNLNNQQFLCYITTFYNPISIISGFFWQSLAGVKCDRTNEKTNCVASRNLEAQDASSTSF
ncbi:MAG: hypothetical protein V7L11_09490 [Nostoc sp.]|uniref:hypothetical protein n=1 Tax=Nostoc sp. TaxID=1180 RepID=UPI002FF6CE73